MQRKKILEEVGEMISSTKNVTHGDPMRNLEHATKLKEVLFNGQSFYSLTDVEKEAINQIMTKCSRLVCGNHDIDSWKDIAGYAAIAAQSRSEVILRDERQVLNTELWGEESAPMKKKKRSRK